MDYQEIRAVVTATPVLAASADGDVRLLTAKRATQMMFERPNGLLVIGLEVGLTRFRTLVGDKREFTRKDMAAIAGVHKDTIRDWLEVGLIQPSIREGTPGLAALFSFRDAFVVGLLGTMQRQRMPHKTMENVYALFAEEQAPV